MNEFELWKNNATVTWAFENNQCKCWLDKKVELAGVGDTSSEAWRNAIEKALEAYDAEQSQ
ncbi:hypothetical protein RMR21_009635 [Agrobacterium sp. rho-8.1]|nr:hypothetical protein [Agrobacterium sp. rho-8.1]